MDFQRFLSETEDFLIPPGLSLSGFSAAAASHLISFQGIRIDTVGWRTFSDFLTKLSDFEDEDFQFHRGRAHSMMHGLAQEILIQRDLGLYRLTISSFVDCYSYDGLIETFKRRPDTSSSVYRIISELPGTMHGTHFVPGPQTEALAQFFLAAALSNIRKIESHQLACYRQIPLMIGGMLRLKGRPAAELELARLFEYLESRPSSRYSVVSAITSSKLPRDLYMRRLSRADRGSVLEHALGL
jgi:hypothetical protein